MGLDDLEARGDLEDVTDNGDLDLSSFVAVTDSVGLAGEADASRAVDLAGDWLTNGGLRRPSCSLSWGTRQRGRFFVGTMPLRVRRDEHLAMRDTHESVL